MKRVDFLQHLAGLFCYKTVTDEVGNEFVVLSGSKVSSICGVVDKTAFEAVENHVHIIDNVKATDMLTLSDVGKTLGRALLCSLRCRFPEKDFVVYVTIKVHDSMIIRFHQKWEGEESYYDPSSFTSPTEKVFAFETEEIVDA